MQKEAIITVVGFLGAGKTTVLKYLTTKYIDKGYNPFIILNDYENANLDAQYFLKQLDAKRVRALSGSCICCSGIQELRNFVNCIPGRENGITLIEANGTSDACSLMGFLGVGLNERFSPPIQISVIDVINWQKRGIHNELEANQIQVSSLIVLTHHESVSDKRKASVRCDIHRLNPLAEIITMNELDISLLPKLLPSQNRAKKIDHLKAHWASCSVDLPNLPDVGCIARLCKQIPESILRIKGCTRIGKDEHFTYFERTPDGKVYTRPYSGIPVTGPKLLTVGLGSDLTLLENAIRGSIQVAEPNT